MIVVFKNSFKDTSSVRIKSLISDFRPSQLDVREALVLAIYLTTIGAFAAGAIEKASQVFQPDDRF